MASLIYNSCIDITAKTVGTVAVASGNPELVINYEEIS